MTFEHDPEALKRELAVALGSRDMAIGFLLGAGCGCSIPDSSGDPLIPAIDALSKIVCDSLRKSPQTADRLAALERQFEEDEEACPPNIEQLLGRVRTLHEIAGKGIARGLSAQDLEILDAAVCSEIETRVRCDLPSGETSYRLFATWLGAAARQQPVEVFTTNYDTLGEQALERSRVPFFDGFVGAEEPFFDLTAMEFDTIPSRWVRLWKIHGSVNWRLRNGSVSRSRDRTSPPLIFPSHLKYTESRRLPYLAMRDRLRTFFRVSPALFITIGYSFSDQHLNEDLLQGLSSNRNSICYALLFDSLDSYPQAHSIARQLPNFKLIARDRGVLRTFDAPWVESSLVGLGDFVSSDRFYSAT